MAPENTDGERLTKVETRLETIESAVLRLENKLDAWSSNFVSRELLDEKLKSRDERIDRIEAEKSTNKHLLPMWVSVSISALAFITSIWSHLNLK